jgi:hypothetical protein
VLALLSQLKMIKDVLLCHNFKLCKQGMNVNTFMIFLKASLLLLYFHPKSYTLLCSVVKHFAKAHSMVYQMRMDMLQHPPTEVKGKATDYMGLMHYLVVGINCKWHFIINMDQTLVYFLMDVKHTLELGGEETVHIHMSTDDKTQVTVAVKITAKGTVLLSVLIFKDQPDGRIAGMEFSLFPPTHHYLCQQNTWVNKAVMFVWVDEVLVPYVEQAPDDIVPLLVLNSY